MSDDVLVMRGVTREYDVGGRLSGGRGTLRALRGIDLAVARGSTLGLVGESAADPVLAGDAAHHQHVVARVRGHHVMYRHVMRHHATSACRTQAAGSRPLPSAGSTQRISRPFPASRSGTGAARQRSWA